MPLAGAGQRFAAEGFIMPKPLVPVAGRRMVDWAISHLDPARTADWHFFVQEEHLRQYSALHGILSQAGGSVQIHQLNGPTPSPIHTLNRRQQNWIKSGLVLITNCDQFLAESVKPWAEAFTATDAAIGVLTVDTNADHYVHMEVDVDGVVVRVIGKGQSEAPAAAGYYFFQSGALLGGLCDQLLACQSDQHELCVTDLVAAALNNGAMVRAWNLGSPGRRYFPLGDPDSVRRYEPQLLKL